MAQAMKMRWPCKVARSLLALLRRERRRTKLALIELAAAQRRASALEYSARLNRAQADFFRAKLRETPGGDRWVGPMSLGDA